MRACALAAEPDAEPRDLSSSSLHSLAVPPPPPLLQLQGIITLWPRQNWVTDLEYTHKYFATGEPLHVMSSSV